MYNQLMKFVSKYYFQNVDIVGKSALTRKVLFKTQILIRTQGSVSAATYIKKCRLAVTKTLSGEKLTLPFGISLSKDQLPRILPYQVRKKIIEGDKETIS